MERSQNVLAVCGGGLEGGEGEERFISKQPLSLATPTWGKDKQRAAWVGEQTEKCLSGTWKEAIWSEGPWDRAWWQSFAGAGEGNELCRFQSLPCPALSPGTSVSRHCKQTARQSLPGEMTRVFVSLGGFHQSGWTGPWTISLFLTWISDTLARALIKQLLCILWNAGPDDHLNSRVNHFSGFLGKTSRS